MWGEGKRNVILMEGIRYVLYGLQSNVKGI